MKRTVLVAACLAAPAFAMAASIHTVTSMDNIYGAGLKTAPGDGNPPLPIKIAPGTLCVLVQNITGSLPCRGADNCITLNSGRDLNDADGGHAQVPVSSNNGAGTISGLKAPGAGYLVGLFTAAGRPSGTMPAALDFTTGDGTSFKSISPLLNQTFFVGNGRTKELKGQRQAFLVPAGARRLYLGISDECNNYTGPPGCYFDNAGSYTVTLQVRRDSCPVPK